MILTPFWSQGIGTEAVGQICEIAFRELALERIIGEVFPENQASIRVLEKNGFRLEETKVGCVVKGEWVMDVRVHVRLLLSLFAISSLCEIWKYAIAKGFKTY